jgi:hypothetical protein
MRLVVIHYGDFTVERFIPTTTSNQRKLRAFRFIASHRLQIADIFLIACGKQEGTFTPNLERMCRVR